MPTIEELKLLQALPLELKIMRTQARIREWVNYYGVDNCYISFSGGKDSTVLLDIVRKMYPKMEAGFVNTGLEFPEIVQFVKSRENVTILRPEMNFKEVIKKYGYPFISKEASLTLHYAYQGKQWALWNLDGKDNKGNDYIYIKGMYTKYKPLLIEKFRLSNKCCKIMKEDPLDNINRKNIVATLAEESKRRTASWLKTGCNSFNKKGYSKPMSFWLEQDVLQYIKENNLPIASVYGEIQNTNDNGVVMFDGCGPKLKCSGCQRTGCIFCMFGAHLDTLKGGEFRLNMLKRTHPKLYDYTMRGGEFNEKGLWQPSINGLGYWYVIKEMNKLYDKTLKSGKVKKFYPIKNGEIEKYENQWNNKELK